MSQYPSPYQPPPPPGYYDYYRPVPSGSGPARRAAVLLIVFGAMGLLLGLCFGGMIWVVPEAQLTQQLQSQPGVTMPPPPEGMSVGEFFRIVVTVSAVIMAFVGLLLLLLAIFVYRGSRGAIVTSIVLCMLVVLLMGMSVIRAATSGTSQALPAACMGFFIVGAFVLALLWLFQGLREQGQTRLQQQQYQAQYAYYQQQQQAYSQGGYGYGQPAPPSPPPPPQAPPPPPPASPGS